MVGRETRMVRDTSIFSQLFPMKLIKEKRTIVLKSCVNENVFILIYKKGDHHVYNKLTAFEIVSGGRAFPSSTMIMTSRLEMKSSVVLQLCMCVIWRHYSRFAKFEGQGTSARLCIIVFSLI